MKPLILAAMLLIAVTTIAQTEPTIVGMGTDIGAAKPIASVTNIGASSMLPCTPSCKVTPVRIFITDETVTESDNIVYLTISISPSSAQTVSVNYKTINGSAKLLKDYTKVLGTVNFLPGEAFKKIAISIVGDNIPESQENFFMELFSPVNGIIEDGSGTITINDAPAIHARRISEAFSAIVMPNPSKGLFLISVLGGNMNPIKWEVYDAVGRLVKKKIQQGRSISLGEELRTGVYTVRLMQGDNVACLQLVKLE